MEMTTNTDLKFVDSASLQGFVENVFLALEVPLDDARIAAHVLVDADLTGRYTHGVSRLPLYASRLVRGVMKARPNLGFESGPFPAMTRLNGDNGLGPVVAWRAMERSIGLAEQFGMGVVAVRLSNHAGSLSAYCEAAAERGFILMALTNSPPGMPPYGGKKAFLGTNPIAFGLPRGSDLPPIVVDLATSVVARGNIIQAARLGEPIPEGWAIDENGHKTTDAEAALRGAVLPMAGSKGYALALVVEIFSGILSGAGVGPGVKNPYTDFSGPPNVGHFFWALNPTGFGPSEVLSDALLELESDIRQVPAMAGESIRLPGERSERKRRDSLRYGIPLDVDLLNNLGALANELGVDPLVTHRGGFDAGDTHV